MLSSRRPKINAPVLRPLQSVSPPRVSNARTYQLAGSPYNSCPGAIGSGGTGKLARLEDLPRDLNQATSSRVRDTSRSKQDTATVSVEVNVQSINFSKSLDSRTTNSATKTQLYVSCLMHFSQLVSENFAGVVMDATDNLQEVYGCNSVKVRRQPCGIILQVELPRSKLVSFQCDLSSGQLAKDLEKWLLTRDLLAQLDGVKDMKLSAEVAGGGG